MKKLLQINPVIRINTSTGRIMKEIGDIAIQNGWESYIAYSKGRDGVKESTSEIVPVGNKRSVVWHGIMTRLFDRHGLASDKATKDFIEKIKEIEPDIIHIHNIHGYFLNYKLLFDYLSKSNAHIIWTIHDCWAYTGHCYHYSSAKCYKWQTICNHCPQKLKFPSSILFDRSRKNFKNKRESFTSIHYDRMTIIPVSYWMCNEMCNSFLSDRDYYVIHNGINTDIFNITDGGDIKKKFDIEDKHIILGVANIWSEEKGLGDFIKLASLISEKQLIVLVGVDKKQKENLPGNILGISRTENIQELAQLYSAADVFVNPTWQDNYPTVNLEAIACGTPVVTYRTGGSIESITNETGFVVEQGDVEGLLHAITEIESKGKIFYQEKCRRFALNNFKKENCYKNYISLYEKVLKKEIL